MRRESFLVRRDIGSELIKSKSRVGRVANSVFRLNIAFATLSKPFPALSGAIQSVPVF
jgi:hypothetical protein